MQMERVLYDDRISLLPNGEWHSEPIRLAVGDVLEVSATAKGRFYAGVFDRRTYHELYGRDSGAFGFEFGTDKRSFETRFRADKNETFYVVLRVGIFSDRTAIRLRAWIFANLETEL